MKLFVLAALIAACAAPAFADDAYVDLQSIERKIASNESMLRRFQAERERLHEVDDSEKIAALDRKIALIERENGKHRARIDGTRKKQETAKIEAKKNAEEAARPATTPAAAEPDAPAELSVEPPADAAYDFKGKDWTMMAPKQKEVLAFTAITGLKRKGVPVVKTVEFYVDALDQLLAFDPFFEDKYLDNLFTFIVGEHEPHARQALAALAQN